MIKILLVDDDKDILKVLKANLTFENYTVVTAESGSEAYEKITTYTPEIIILDLNLPDIDGIQLCKRLRSEDINIPIIMLTARDSLSDKILGLECGADDYIIKPFNFLELNARIKNCIRRLKEININANTELLKYKSLTINLEKHEILQNDRKIELTKTEYNLFIYLFQNRTKVSHRKEIIDILWKDKDIYNWSRTVDIHITHLRKKLPDDITIKTVAGFGFVLE